MTKPDISDSPTVRAVRAMNEAIAEERERCAKTAEIMGDDLGEPAIGGAIAKAIRSITTHKQ